MIDSFSLLLSHGLLFFTAWRLIWRPDLDDDTAEPKGPVKPPFAAFIRGNKPGA